MGGGALQGEEVVPHGWVAVVGFAGDGDGVESSGHTVVLIVLGLARLSHDGDECAAKDGGLQANGDGASEHGGGDGRLGEGGGELIDGRSDAARRDVGEGDGCDGHHVVEDKLFAVSHVLMGLMGLMGPM